MRKITVFLFNEDHTPSSYAWVYLERPTAPGVSSVVQALTTSGSVTLSYDETLPCMHMYIFASGKNSLRAQSPTWFEPPPDGTKVSLTLHHRSMQMTVHVKNEFGVKIANADVRILEKRFDGDLILSRRLTDSTGSILLGYDPQDHSSELVVVASNGTVSGSTKAFRDPPLELFDVVITLQTTWKVNVEVIAEKGAPLPGAIVTVLRRQIGVSDLAVTGPGSPWMTNEQGRVEASFPAFSSADLVVNASSNGRTSTSPVILDAGPFEQVVLRIGDQKIEGPSSFDIAYAAIEGVLALDGFTTESLPSLSANNLALIASRSGIAIEDVVFLRDAIRCRNESGVQTSVFYGLAKQGVSIASVTSLSSVGRSSLLAALQAAQEANQIPTDLNIVDAANALSMLAQAATLLVPSGATRPTLGKIFSLAKITSATPSKLATTYANGGDPWGLLTSADAQNLNDSLQFSTILKNHLPLIEKLAGSGKGTVQALATMSRTELSNHVGTNLPASLIGEVLTKDVFVDRVFAALEEVAPTKLLAARLDAFSATHKTDIQGFLARNTTFDLRKPIDPKLFAEIPSVLDLMQGVQRIFRLAPRGRRFEVTGPLLRDGFHSAQKIVAAGRTAFVRKYGTELGGDIAGEVFDRARTAASMAALMLARNHQAFDGARMAFLPPPPTPTPTDPDGFPEWEELFGSLDFCSCDECQSVYSPAAYFVDLLDWLAHRETTIGNLKKNVLKDVLSARRPDLTGIQLSCKNTNTPLPYIDLVNEVMEKKVSGSTSTTAYQTIGAAEDLAAEPEHIDPAAYTILANLDPNKPAIYPFELPFDLFADQARTYLALTGVERHELVRKFGPAGATTRDTQAARETLGLSEAEWSIITVGTTGVALERCWGSTTKRPITRSSLTVLSNLLAQARAVGSDRMDFDELLELLRSRFVQGTAPVSVTFPADTFSTDKATVDNLTEAVLGRLHRFIRLSRRLGWSVKDLDRAIEVLGGGKLDDQFLIAVSHVVRLCKERGFTVEEVLGLFGDLDTRRWKGRVGSEIDGGKLVWGYRDGSLAATPGPDDDPSPYDRQFLAAPIHDAFTVAADGKDVKGKSTDLSIHSAELTRLLGIDAEELAVLVGRLKHDSGGQASPLASLSNLSYLARHVALARASRLTIGEFVAWLDILPEQPFAPKTTLTAVERLQRLLGFFDELDATRARFTIPELAYLLQHRECGSSLVGPTDKGIDKALEPLHETLHKAYADFPESDPGTAEARADALENGVIAWIKQEFGVSSRACDLFRKRTLTVSGQSKVVQEALFELGRLEKAPTGPPEQAEIYLRLFKASLLVDRAGLADTDFDWVFGEEGPFPPMLDVFALPIVSGSTADYSSWKDLRDAVLVRDKSERDVFDLFESLKTAGSNVLATNLDTVATAMDWSREALGEVAAALNVSSNWTSLARGTVLRSLADGVVLVGRTGCPAGKVRQWASLGDPKTQAEDIRTAVRARFDAATWRRLVKPGQDRLRERRRDALTAYLIGNVDTFFSGTDALFHHLLLDVEMGAAQLTSRIKQAIGSVQLFIDRAHLNLEQALKLDEDDVREWEWMKNYRVWEANRKVFLYPENYLEPDLRDDKTPFFVELENELSQGDLTDERAETAVRRYLERLDEAGRLEVVAVYDENQNIDDPVDLLHVFARTHGEPHRYFYRQRVRSKHWTPWEPVALDIEGDHLIPVVHNRRLYLFWPEFSEVAMEEVPDIPDKGQDVDGLPKKSWELRLSWSERISGKWTGKKASKLANGGAGDAGFKKDANESTPGSFSFHTSPDPKNGDLLIEVLRWTMLSSSSRVILDPHFERLRGFRFSARNGSLVLEDPPIDKPLKPLAGFLPHYQAFRWVAKGSFSISGLNAAVGSITRVLLDAIPKGSTLVLSDRDIPAAEQSFFLQDREHAFFVERIQRPRWRREAPLWAKNRAIPFDFQFAERLLWGDVAFDKRANPWNAPFVPVQHAPALQLSHGSPAEPIASAPKGLLAKQFNSAIASLGANARFIDGKETRPTKRAFNVRTELTMLESGKILGSSGTWAPPEDECPSGPELLQMSGGGTGLVTGLVNTAVLKTILIAPRLSIDVPAYLPSTLRTPFEFETFRFHAFEHPYAGDLVRQLNRYGLEGIYNPKGTLLLPRQGNKAEYFDEYSPTVHVSRERPRDCFDFTPGGAYSIYNWELFFHVPFLVATQLTLNRRFEDARKWFHYIFDPTIATGKVEEHWKVGPFAALLASTGNRLVIEAQRLLTEATGSDDDIAEKLRGRDELVDQIEVWKDNPFSPHAIARLRLPAYQKAVVMKYLDNLIEWADDLFRRDTLETINEATLLYVLAAQILGPRPQQIRGASPDPVSYRDLQTNSFGADKLLERIEVYLPESLTRNPLATRRDELPLVGKTSIFCIPPNARLLTDYWDRVADRLFKIRHSLNIEGVFRTLALFEPPIDPMLLVRAKAAGLDLGEVLGQLSSPAPRQRFSLLVQKAVEFCGDVRALGSALLSALEKEDAEELSQLRASHEVKLQTAVRAIKERAVEEAEQAIEGLKKSKENVQQRLKFYQSRKFMNAEEKNQERHLDKAKNWTMEAEAIDIFMAHVSRLPSVSIGVSGAGGSPHATVEYGGEQLGAKNRARAMSCRANASWASTQAQMAGTLASYQRRADDWKLQADLAAKEIEGLEKQILGAEIRLAMAEKELENLDLQIEQAADVETFLKDKFTNRQLYSWMVKKLSSLYFQSFKLARDLANRAQQAWKAEIGDDSRDFIGSSAYWDGLRKGLLSGELLHFDLKRMEAEYLGKQKREYELTQNISLGLLDPFALEQLKQAGSCTFTIPEEWYDLDSPGHYFRRLKTVALSLPSVTGPYAPVRCKLTLIESRIRVSPNPNTTSGPGYAYQEGDERFKEIPGGVESIVTSRASEDSGLFETNLRDPQLLPFEGAGAVGTWTLTLPDTFRQFDYSTIADAILHIRYTARDGGILRSAAISSLKDRLVGGGTVKHAFSAAGDFPDQWHVFTTAGCKGPLTLDLDSSCLVFQAVGYEALVSTVHLILPTTPGSAPATCAVSLETPSAPPVEMTLMSDADGKQPLAGSLSIAAGIPLEGTWTIGVPASLASILNDVILAVELKYKPRKTT